MRNFVGLVLICLATSVIFASLIYYSLLHIEPTDISWEAAQGKKIWDDYGCIQCHAIVGNGGYSAPDLTNILTLRDEEWIKQFFTEPPLMPASRNKRHKQLEQNQVKNLLEYLRLVDQINTLNWPPPPEKKGTLKVKRIN